MKTTISYRTLLSSTFIFLFLLGSASAQNELTATEWQEDLGYLQKKVHKDYPFLFKKVTAKTFDTEIEKLYDAIPTMQPHEIKVGLARMVSLFEYGHTQIPFSTLARDAVLPINLYQFEDGIYVEGIQKSNRNLLGAKLIKIAGAPVKEVIKAVRPVVPVENDQYFKAYGLRFLTVPSILHAQGLTETYSETITLTFEKDGQVFDSELTAIPLSDLPREYGFIVPNASWLSAREPSKTPLYLKHLNDKYYYFELLPDTKTLYVRQSSVFNDENETLKDFYKRLFSFIDTNKVEKLVYDVRLNGGGNNYNNKPLIQGILARPKLNARGKFFFIIGRDTFSACQNLTNEIENYTEAIMVGEPTSENKNFYGDARKVTLPNSGINTYLSHAWWQDLPPWENKDWTQPHIAVEMDFKAYASNQDPVLEAALNYTETGFILDPMQHLTQLFIAGKFEQVKIDGYRIANDPAYKYHDFKEEFSSAGYRLLQGGDTQGGLFILELIAEFYPNETGPLFNLATAQEEAKLIDKARENYKKLIALDAKGTMGRVARKKLADLNRK